MSPSDSRNEEVLFDRALKLPEADRRTFLEEACGGDTALRAAVEALLRAHLSATDFLPSAIGGSRSYVETTASVAEEPGDRIGRYKLLQKIGEGGCGIVYMAEQEEPVRRRVALKVIKLGMDTKAVVARFDAERQALAMMDHPNIAKVLDAGATDSGRPFFVMELVRGIPVTKYCDDNGLATGKRLELFSRICHAIQHAHQKGIIHRDIKPTNILVVLHDGVPVPKVIDFGIVKATHGRLTDQTLFTAFEQFIGTPAYMSPEQAELSGLDIDTRSDIYSLGVLLYELLAGRPPFDPKTFLAVGVDEMRRVIREVDPPRPSTRLSTLAEADQTTVAKLRGTAPAQLSTVLAGDLDWIVMRCLEKDRTRRYETAAALAADVQRHLAHEPVAARPPSATYRVRKFCRRNKAFVFAVSAVTLALVAGLIASATMFLRERAARQRASAAEQAEGQLRQQAETARTEEVTRAARTALDLANRNLADGRVADGLAYLVYAARKDPLNPTLGPRIASVLASHNFMVPQAAPLACGSRVLALRFSQDGRSFFVGTADGTFRVMDAATGEIKRQFQTGREVVPEGWEFARLNDTIVGARFADNTFALYDIATGAMKFPPIQLSPKIGFHESSRIIDLTPSGRWIYAAAPGEFWLWRADTGATQLHLSFDEINSGCDFSPTEDTLAIIVGRAVKRWTIPAGQPIGAPLPFHTTAPYPFGATASDSLGAEVRFSPDGKLLAITDRSSAQILDGTTGSLLSQIPSLGSALVPRVTTFATNDRVLVRSQTKYGWWDLALGRFTSVSVPQVTNVFFNASVKRGVARSLDGLLRIFDVGSTDQVVEPAWRQGTPYCPAISPDGTQVIMGAADGLLYRFKVGNGTTRPLMLPRSQGSLMPARFLPERPTRLLIPARDWTRVIQVATGHEAAGGFRFPEPVVHFPLIRPDLRYLVVFVAGQGWQSWELGSEGVQRAVPLQNSGGPLSIPIYVSGITFSLGNDLVAVSNRAPARVWNLRTGAPVGPPMTVPGLNAPFSLTLSPDGSRLVMGARDGSVLVLEVATGRPLLSLKTSRQVRTWSTQYSPDGERILTTNEDGECRLWNSTTGEPIGPIVQVIGARGGVGFSPDGRWAAVQTPATVTLMDGRTGVGLNRRIPSGRALASFSPDSSRLSATDNEGNAQVWDVSTGEAVTEPMRHPGVASLPEFSPDGRYLKTEDTHTKLWAIPPALPKGTPVPEWLLELATLLASQVVNDAGQLVPATETFNRVESLRHQIATLPADAPLADWGRWVLDDRPERPIAPGFTITPAEADQLVSDVKP